MPHPIMFSSETSQGVSVRRACLATAIIIGFGPQE